MLGFALAAATAAAILILSRTPVDAEAPPAWVWLLAVTHVAAYWRGMRRGRRNEALTHGLVVAANHPVNVPVYKALGQAMRRSI